MKKKRSAVPKTPRWSV